MAIGTKKHPCKPHAQDVLYNKRTRVFTTDSNGLFHCTVCGATQTDGVKATRRTED